MMTAEWMTSDEPLIVTRVRAMGRVYKGQVIKR